MNETLLTDRVLATMRRLKHYARAEFIWKMMNEEEETGFADVRAVIENLSENGVIEGITQKDRRYWRIKKDAVAATES